MIKRQIIILLAATGFIVVSYGATAIIALLLLRQVRNQNCSTDGWERLRSSSIFVVNILIPAFTVTAICRIGLHFWSAS